MKKFRDLLHVEKPAQTRTTRTLSFQSLARKQQLSKPNSTFKDKILNIQQNQVPNFETKRI
jgi:hypothetical protein